MMKSTYSVSEIAHILRLSDKAILDSIYRGELPAVKGKETRKGFQPWEISFDDAATYIKRRMYKRTIAL